MDKTPKSAYELALEKLKDQDRQRGEDAPLALSDAQKKEIAELRKVCEAKLAEREILFRSERARLQLDPEAAEKLAKSEEDYGRDRRRLEEQRDAAIARVRSASTAPGGKAGAAGTSAAGRRGGRKGRGAARAVAAFALGLAAAVGAVAQSAAAGETPAGGGASGAVTQGRVVIRAARLFDPVDGVLKRDAEVTVEGDAIRSVRVGRVPVAGRAGADAGSPPPATGSPVAVTIDLGDATLLPGLIDAHTHVLLQGDPTARSYDEQILNESIAHRTVRAVAAARTALLHGFTTLRDLGSEGAGYADVALRDGIAEGHVPGPRLFVATLALDITGAYPLLGFSPETRLPTGVQVADGPDAGRRAVREQVQHGTDWIKVYCDRAYFVNDDGALDSIPTFDPDELAAIVDEAHRQGKKVAAHAMAPKGIGNALRAGVDSIEHGVGLDAATIKLMLRRGVVYCPTLTVTEYVAPERSAEGRGIWDRIPEFHHRSFQAALSAGVPIAFGTDAGGFPWDGPNQAEEFPAMVRLGMSEVAALRAATTVAAALLGRDGDLGRIAPGYRADLIAVRGNPLERIDVMKDVGFVMARGRIEKNGLAAGQ